MTANRLLDYFGALVVGLLLFPLAVIALIGVLAFSGRPLFFVQNRVGMNQTPIKIIKIRTMSVGADAQHTGLLRTIREETGELYLRTSADPRVTPLGRVLRYLSIDEYPQLLNVLKGEMSMVGPRPMLPEEVLHLDKQFLPRFDVQPGLTGLAQVSGRKALTSERSLELDVIYAKRKSFWLNAWILLQTPWVMIRGTGAW